MKDLGKDSVSRHRISEDAGGQRIDNYLLKILKGVPKSYVYRILRSGEVRVNGGRAKPHHRGGAGGAPRIPPLRGGGRPAPPPPPAPQGRGRPVLFGGRHPLGPPQAARPPAPPR